MDIAIYGAGAIGLDMGVHFIEAGHKVTFIARDETLAALIKDGIKYQDAAGKQLSLPPAAFRSVGKAEEAGVQDIVFLTAKADVLLDISYQLGSLFNKNTIVVSATNGIPPWYSYLQDNTIGKFLRNTEVRETFLRNVGGERMIGAVIERSVSKVSPNAVVHTFGAGYKIGELNHVLSDRLIALRDLMENAGLSADISNDIHKDIWLKLIANVGLNPLSVLAETNIGGLLSDPQLAKEVSALMDEAETVGIVIGVIKQGDFNRDRLLSFARSNLAHHEPSMLQNFRMGKPLEVNRIVEVVIMFAELKGVDIDVPHLRSVQQRLVNKLKSS